MSTRIAGIQQIGTTNSIAKFIAYKENGVGYIYASWEAVPDAVRYAFSIKESTADSFTIINNRITTTNYGPISSYTISASNIHTIDTTKKYQVNIRAYINNKWTDEPQNPVTVEFIDNGDKIPKLYIEKALIDFATINAINIATNANNISTNMATNTTNIAANDEKRELIDNKIYSGTDLVTKFSSEITDNNPWAWIKDRITSGDFTGINVGDYIRVSINNNPHNIYIMGINTYSHSSGLGKMIDFISSTGVFLEKLANDDNTNNGSEQEPNPWRNSVVYRRLNESNVEPNDGGFYASLPSALKNVISKKILTQPIRFSSSSSLLGIDNGRDAVDLGYLWLPTYKEITGELPPLVNPSFDGSLQYPFFSSKLRPLYYQLNYEKPMGILTPESTEDNSLAGQRWYVYNTYYDTQNGKVGSLMEPRTVGEQYSSSQPIVVIPLCFRIDDTVSS